MILWICNYLESINCKHWLKNKKSWDAIRSGENENESSHSRKTKIQWEYKQFTIVCVVKHNGVLVHSSFIKLFFSISRQANQRFRSKICRLPRFNRSGWKGDVSSYCLRASHFNRWYKDTVTGHSVHMTNRQGTKVQSLYAATEAKEPSMNLRAKDPNLL